MKNQLLLITLFFLITTACKNTNQTGTTTESESSTSETIPEPTTNTPAKLTVNIDNLRLRATAGQDGAEIARLPKGTLVYDQGEVSDFTTKVKLRGIQFDEPWIKVKTENDIEGWIYTGGLHFNLDTNHQLSEKLMDLRLQNIFGKGIAKQIKLYRSYYDQASTSRDFAKAYRKGLQTRDTMVRILSEKIPDVDPQQMADLLWLEKAVPGYRVQLVAEGTAYYLFNDYKMFDNKAKSTSGKEDDSMADLFFTLFEVDSVEHFYPSWFFQTWDYGGASLLGRGIHYKMLQKMETNYESGQFNEVIDDLRIRMINDITSPHTEYWEPKKLILDEVNKILDKGFKQLSKEDVIAIEIRKKMFENPKANKIKMDLKSGR